MNANQIQKILALNIKRVRKELGYSQAKLAELADLSNGFMCDIENCRKWPGPKNLCSLAKALQLQPYQLIVPADESLHIEKHHILATYTKELKAAIAEGVDFAYEKIMNNYTTESFIDDRSSSNVKISSSKD